MKEKVSYFNFLDIYYLLFNSLTKIVNKMKSMHTISVDIFLINTYNGNL